MDFCFDHWEWEDPRLRRKIRKDPKVTDGGVPRRKVNYAKTCAVILIPSRLEYSDAGIDLWYDKKDLKASQHQASAELKRLIEENPALTMESAMAYLYQPSVDVYFRDNSNSWSSGGILNVLVVDKNPDTAEETIKLLRQYQKRWDWNTNIAQSGEKAIKTIKSGTRDLDVVFIDENIGRGGGLSFAALMTIFRSVYGEDVFIGCTLSEGSEQTRKDAIKAGCDFMWQRPFQALLDMLPVILSSRSTKRSRQNSLGNSRNSSSGGLSSISPEAAASLTRSGSGSRSGSVSGVPTPNSTSLASSPTRSNSASPHGLLAENIHYVHGTHTSGDIITSSGSPVDNMLAERLALAGCGCSGSSSSGACGTSHSEDIHSRPPRFPTAASSSSITPQNNGHGRDRDKDRDGGPGSGSGVGGSWSPHSNSGATPTTSSGTSLFTDAIGRSGSGSGRDSPNHHHPHSLLPPPLVVGQAKRRNSHLSELLANSDSFDKLEGSPVSSPPRINSSTPFDETKNHRKK